MSGRAVVLMSGGIDSPVAAYRMMRRGLRCTLPALLRHAADRAGVGVQGVRAGPRAGPVPGRIAAVRGAVREGAAGAGHLGGRAAAGDGAAAADAQDRRGAGRSACTRTALVTGDSLGPGLQPDADEHHRARRRGHSCRSCARCSAGTRPRSWRRRAGSTRSPSPSSPTRTAARCSPRAGWRPGPKIDDLRRIEIRLDADELAEQLALTAQEYRPE